MEFVLSGIIIAMLLIAVFLWMSMFDGAIFNKKRRFKMIVEYIKQTYPVQYRARVARDALNNRELFLSMEKKAKASMNDYVAEVLNELDPEYRNYEQQRKQLLAEAAMRLNEKTDGS